MISRFALAALALTSLADGAAATPSGQARTGASAAETRPAGSLGRRKGAATLTAIAVLPPPRPDREAASSELDVAKPDAAAAEPELRGSLTEQVGPIVAAPLPPMRPSFRSVAEPSFIATLPELAAAPAPSSLFSALFAPRAAPLDEPPAIADPPGRARLDQLIAAHARLNGVPEALVHRVVIRESRYNPRAIGRGGAMGLMQIKTATARGVGYEGGPAGLLDAETNLTYAVKYLGGAYRTAGGDFDRAVGYYARGYYYAAKRQGLGSRLARRSPTAQPELGIEPPAPAAAPVLVSAAEDRATR